MERASRKAVTNLAESLGLSFSKMRLKSLAREVAENCGYLQELLMLENLYDCGDYSAFLYSLRENSQFTLYGVDILRSFAGCFNEHTEFFKEWLENEGFGIGRESVLSFLELDLKITFDDFLDDTKEVKERIVQAFVYSCSVALYDYFSENAILKEHLALYPTMELVEDF